MIQAEVDYKSSGIVILKKSIFELRFIPREKDRYLVETHQQCLEEVNRIIRISNGIK